MKMPTDLFRKLYQGVCRLFNRNVVDEAQETNNKEQDAKQVQIAGMNLGEYDSFALLCVRPDKVGITGLCPQNNIQKILDFTAAVAEYFKPHAAMKLYSDYYTACMDAELYDAAEVFRLVADKLQEETKECPLISPLSIFGRDGNGKRAH